MTRPSLHESSSPTGYFPACAPLGRLRLPGDGRLGDACQSCCIPSFRADLGWRAACGLALMVSLGGCLNLAGFVSRPMILALVVGGLAALVFASPALPERIATPEHSRPWLFYILYSSVYAVAAVRFAGSALGALACGSFNCHDDFQAYFVFPTKLLELGSIAPDPFNLRLLTALGGQTFLHTFILAALPPESLNLLDGGIGMILVVTVLAGYSRHVGISPPGRGFVSLAFLMIGAPVANISSLLIALGLLLSLFRILDSAGAGNGVPAGTAKALLISLHVAALCSLKATLILPVVMMLACGYATALLKRGQAAWRELLTVVLASGALLTPWMAALYRTSGTPLYPTLGKGYASYAYSAFVKPYGDLEARRLLAGIPWAQLLALIVLTALAGVFRTRAPEKIARIGLISAAVIGIAATAAMLNGFDTYRFVYPVLIAAILIELVHAIAPDRKIARLPRWWIAACVVVLLIGESRNATEVLFRYATIHIAGAIRGALAGSSVLRQRLGTLQQSVPPGAVLMARLEYPFLLDFRRNTIYDVDWPGGSALPPGMPFFGGAEPLAAYLLSNAIRYVAYDYATEAGFPRTSLGERLQPSRPYFVRTSARLVFDFQDNLWELGKSRRRIYDDHHAFVLDLAQMSATPP
jgi:hypothetical protein